MADENAQRQADDLGAQFTEQFVQDPEHVTLLLALLEVGPVSVPPRVIEFNEIRLRPNLYVSVCLFVFSFLKEFDFHVRWPGVKLLTALLKNQGTQVQGIILVSPMGEGPVFT